MFARGPAEKVTDTQRAVEGEMLEAIAVSDYKTTVCGDVGEDGVYLRAAGGEDEGAGGGHGPRRRF